MAAALFADGAVVTEGKSDLALYETAHLFNEELAATGTAVHFVNARNKRSVPNFLGPLRGFGVPAAAVVDLDVLKSNDTWGRLLHSARVPAALVEGFKNQRSKIEESFRINGLDMGTGIDGLPSGDREAARDLIGTVRQYGVFVFPEVHLNHG
jgi:hypothetical protein